VAQVLATRLMPELVRGLVLISTPAYQHSFNPNWPLPDMEKQQDPELPFHTPVEQLINQLRQTLPQASANPQSISGATLDALVNPWQNELGKELFYQQIRGLVPYYLNAVEADLSYLRCPTLIIWGEKDTIFPQQWGVRLNRNIPNSQMQVVRGAGHLILHDAPDQVARLVADFLAKV
jgi:pimeloyl-ACP methyl ester carboxylesterase